MSPSPAHLRAAATDLRGTARRVDLGLSRLAARGDRETWRGPAATSFRRTAVDAEGRAASVAAGLRRVAEGLEHRAAFLEARAAAEARALEEAAAARAAEPPPWGASVAPGGGSGPGVHAGPPLPLDLGTALGPGGGTGG